MTNGKWQWFALLAFFGACGQGAKDIAKGGGSTGTATTNTSDKGGSEASGSGGSAGNAGVLTGTDTSIIIASPPDGDAGVAPTRTDTSTAALPDAGRSEGGSDTRGVLTGTATSTVTLARADASAPPISSAGGSMAAGGSTGSGFSSPPASSGTSASTGYATSTGIGSGIGTGGGTGRGTGAGTGVFTGAFTAGGTMSGVSSSTGVIATTDTASATGTATASKATATATATKTSSPTGGKLTAGTWDDNLNFDFYLTYLGNTVAAQLAGIPIIDRAARMVILVKTAAGQPVAGAQVVVTDGSDNAFSTTTGADGRALYFPGWYGVLAGTSVTVTASMAIDVVTKTVAASAGTVELTLAQAAAAPVAALDLAFVVDTTGSMQDEISYLQSELDNIVGGITGQFPGIDQRFALVVYRDQGDLYVVRSFDFTADLAAFRQTLNAQTATGGGDMPEAVDQALAATTQLTWRGGPAARVAFWIADAPHHVGKETTVVSALRDAVGKGVHIYPVAASGIDDLGEFTMRTAAEVTGGRYLFLTNDSGIGGAHQEPHIPCYYVTTLESAMRRMITTELTGNYIPPTADEVIRTGGDPQDQRCTLSSGVVVMAF
jgi:hypothetical protein